MPGKKSTMNVFTAERFLNVSFSNRDTESDKKE
nr:MAG TPA: hypothetical protein [Bacteriophage sp.]